MAGSSMAIKTETENTQKVVDTNKATQKVVDTNRASDEKVAVVVLNQTKHKNNASVIPAKKRLVKRMMFDSMVNSFASSLAFSSRSSSSESDKAADDDHLPLSTSINDKKK
ncbi:hypothetical protein FNV43_RR12240 [Rhamnella rubrinervis]|uniref:Uncharacterized protein n=1 Tax=Rhamnella rubrinervis TaxID=2594499 RepID=A0A8K0H7X8_9ROSA|nr:hypothetical protein FNV43_RR12240 [Rhamnella rubrinervis]